MPLKFLIMPLIFNLFSWRLGLRHVCLKDDLEMIKQLEAFHLYGSQQVRKCRSANNPVKDMSLFMSRISNSLAQIRGIHQLNQLFSIAVTGVVKVETEISQNNEVIV